MNYGSYPAVELSSEPNNIIVGYGGNSYNGIIRKSNEDRIKIVANYKLELELQDPGLLDNDKIDELYEKILSNVELINEKI